VPFVPEKFQFLGTVSKLHILDLEVMGISQVEGRRNDKEILQDYFFKNLINANHLEPDLSEDMIMEKIVKFINKQLF
jgi:hypothetical protein